MNATSSSAVSRGAHLAPAKPSGYYSNSRDELLALIPETAARVLDVGCAEGALGARLKTTRRNAIEVVGIEVCESAAAMARSRLDKVIVADLESLALEHAGKFDCVVLADVLEHLRDPWRILAAVSKCLRPDGAVVASIPNVQYWRVVLGLLRGCFDYADDGVLDRTHLRFFTRKTAIELFSDAGFELQYLCPHIPTARGRLLNTCTGGLFAGFFAFQYHAVARHRLRP